MRRTEPPPLATWVLEHLTPGDRDEALAGDLLEVFRTGRSDAWYWRQTLGALLAAWNSHLTTRWSLLIFAALWCSLAPAWTLLMDRLGDGIRAVAATWELDWPLADLFRTGSWIVLNFAFLWAGIALYVVSHRCFAKVFSPRKVRRSFGLVAALFLPVYFATLILMNLYAFPGFDVDRRALTPARELTDVTLWANALRLPYFVTLMCALWGTVPRSRLGRHARLQHPELQAQAQPLPSTEYGLFFLIAGAGLLNAMIAGFLLSRLPEPEHPHPAGLILRAVLYVAAGALAGVAGEYLYWHNRSSPFREHPPLPFRQFALTCSAAWVWVPAFVLFANDVSPAAALVATAGAFVLASGMRAETSPLFASASESLEVYGSGDELFAESLAHPRLEPHGYVIAICLYAAGWALATRANLAAAAFLGFAAFLFSWKRTITPARATHDQERRATLRLARVTIPALLVTFWALLEGVEHRAPLIPANLFLLTAQKKPHKPDDSRIQAVAANDISGYRSVILWPVSPKKQIILPVLTDPSILAPGTTRPLIIRFDGPYWFLQPPDTHPGPKAHQARGNPLALTIHSNNAFPLTMEAHQPLARAIRLARCREIQVGILNRDNLPGDLSLAVLLTDSGSPGKPTLFLGEQPIVSSAPGHFAIRTVAVPETLRFPVPSRANLRKFDEITMMVVPDPGHTMVAPQIAVSELQLFPR